MRDLDDMVGQLRELYPGHTWSRQEILQLFYLDLTTDKLEWIGNLIADDDDPC